MKPAAPLISIIVAVYNGAATLQRCLDSISQQTYSQRELIVIDGGSADGTVDLLRSRGEQIGYWISEPDDGIYDAWNKALRQARGEWICFLGADDYFWRNDVLERLSPYLVAELKAKLVYGQVAVVTEQNETLYTIGEAWEDAKSKLCHGMSVPHPGLMHHRSWFDKYDSFDASYFIAGDYEMLLRGWPSEEAVFVPDLIVVGMMQGGMSSTPQNAIRQLREVRRAQREHGIASLGMRLSGAFLRVYTRLVLEKILGVRITYQLLDAGRVVLGKKPYWTKL